MNRNVESDEGARCCTTCTRPIPLNRLEAVPTASQCVECLENDGDVKHIRRYDEVVNDEIVSTYYKTPNQYLKQTILAFNGLGSRLGNSVDDEIPEPMPIRTDVSWRSPESSVVKLVDMEKTLNEHRAG